MTEPLSLSELDTAILKGNHLAEDSAAWKAQYRREGRAPDFTGIENVDPRTIGTAPDTFQFRPECGPTGVCPGHGIKSDYDPGRAGIALVYEYRDGSRFVVDGHHRLDFLKNHPDGDIQNNAPPADIPDERRVMLTTEVMREADGWTPRMARAIGAMKNLAEGSTTVPEAAAALGVSPELLRERWEHNLHQPVPPPKAPAPAPVPERAPGEPAAAPAP